MSRTTDLRRVRVHCQGDSLWQDQIRPEATGGTDRAEQIGSGIAQVPRRRRPPALFGPPISQAALPADPDFILPPAFDGPIARGCRDDTVHKDREVSLCTCDASVSALGFRGCTMIWLKSIAFSIRLHHFIDGRWRAYHGERPLAFTAHGRYPVRDASEGTFWRCGIRGHSCVAFI